jgi:hypothetical protein
MAAFLFYLSISFFSLVISLNFGMPVVYTFDNIFAGIGVSILSFIGTLLVFIRQFAKSSILNYIIENKKLTCILGIILIFSLTALMINFALFIIPISL